MYPWERRGYQKDVERDDEVEPVGTTEDPDFASVEDVGDLPPENPSVDDV